MISMELQPAAHLQHLGHSHQQHHNDLNVYQHQMTNINGHSGDEKSKSKSWKSCISLQKTLNN